MRSFLLFRQFFNCRRHNSVPIKVPNAFLLARNLVFAKHSEARSRQRSSACSTTREAIAGTLCRWHEL